MNNKNSWIGSMEDEGYSVLDCIDYGSFSDVFTVKKYDNEKLLAVKKIESSRSDDDDVLSEIRCLHRLRHRHIIQLRDVVMGERTACIIMEYAPHGNLQDYCKKNAKLSDGFIFNAFGQLLSALSFCHSQHIAHRDVNPSNVLVVSATLVKLGDFGLGFNCTDADGRPRLCDEYLGQTAYLAPEVLMHCPFQPILADVWSLGCVLYFMCFNAKPFTGSEESVLSVQLQEGLELPEVTLPPLFRSSMCDMCASDVTGRRNVDSVAKQWLSIGIDDV